MNIPIISINKLDFPDLYPESILANDYLNMRLKEINLK